MIGRYHASTQLFSKKDHLIGYEAGQPVNISTRESNPNIFTL